MIRALLLVLLMAVPASAVAPGEMLDDPVLEARAREISQGLRCPVCRNESIDESGAAVAADLRLLVRERLLAGDPDAAVVAHIVARYGPFVLLRPQATGGNLVLWLAGPGLLLAGGIAAWSALRRGARAVDVVALDAEEAGKLARFLQDPQ